MREDVLTKNKVLGLVLIIPKMDRRARANFLRMKMTPQKVIFND
jgi:hypothetical protein